MRRLAACLMLLTLAAALAAAASVDGTWIAEAPGRNGTVAVTFTFRSSGDAVQGYVDSQDRRHSITDGRLSGNRLTFKIVVPEGGDLFHEGIVRGQTISFSRYARLGGQAPNAPVEFTARKAN